MLIFTCAQLPPRPRFLDLDTNIKYIQFSILNANHEARSPIIE